MSTGRVLEEPAGTACAAAGQSLRRNKHVPLWDLNSRSAGCCDLLSQLMRLRACRILRHLTQVAHAYFRRLLSMLECMFGIDLRRNWRARHRLLHSMQAVLG